MAGKGVAVILAARFATFWPVSDQETECRMPASQRATTARRSAERVPALGPVAAGG